jgi:hypothetical protein
MIDTMMTHPAVLVVEVEDPEEDATIPTTEMTVETIETIETAVETGMLNLDWCRNTADDVKANPLHPPRFESKIYTMI